MWAAVVLSPNKVSTDREMHTQVLNAQVLSELYSLRCHITRPTNAVEAKVYNKISEDFAMSIGGPVNGFKGKYDFNKSPKPEQKFISYPAGLNEKDHKKCYFFFEQIFHAVNKINFEFQEDDATLLTTKKTTLRKATRPPSPSANTNVPSKKACTDPLSNNNNNPALMSMNVVPNPDPPLNLVSTQNVLAPNSPAIDDSGLELVEFNFAEDEIPYFQVDIHNVPTNIPYVDLADELG